MKLYQYHHCPYCVRADMVANYKNIRHEKVYLLNDDEQTCLQLVNQKIVPILALEDGTVYTESLKIAAYLDKVGDHTKTIRKAHDNDAFNPVLDGVQDSIKRLLYPRNILLGLPEFVTQSARDYFQLHKEKALNSTFNKALEESPKHIKNVSMALARLPTLPLPSQHNNTISWDDVLLFPRLRNLTMVSGLVFPDQVIRYLEEVSALTDVHTYFNFEI
ncbi:glutaredoxin 2 [Marinomonas pollencensis]|uniref:Glutaredoxin 2 n=1 Tax=Marinomonas pollencensis TaxID=491954 RepID=A0A3E0DTN0_9GAMM|nr:glutaredoxin 2 [Marinomonas pollencensis]REG86929.1 glutaredoxin 2 [Marinomonas pollencensis]